MSEEASTQATTTPQPKPVPDGYTSWTEYWTKEHAQPWRTEPKISEEREQYLTERRAIQPDIEKGIYPFRDEKGSVKLNRADVEWLLATHHSGGMRGPVNWNRRAGATFDDRWTVDAGLDLRGANLAGCDLQRLPLAMLLGGLSKRDAASASAEQVEAAAIHLEGAVLTLAHLEGAQLRGAHFEGSIVRQVRLDAARLTTSHFEGADLSMSHLEGAQVFGTQFNARRLSDQELSVIRMRKPDFPCILQPADMPDTYCDSTTRFVYPILSPSRECQEYGGPLLLDVHWEGVNLGAIEWESLTRLGNERLMETGISYQGKPMDATQRHRARLRAVRSYRQVASLLRAQGITEAADRFAYRAQLCQRQVLRRQGGRKWATYFGSWFLDFISGYGYKPMRSLIAYILIISAFAGAYLLNAQFAAPHLTWDEALVLSISAFHGRGFFTSGISLGDTLARLAAGEAIIGLLIEITFIATFTQRFFAR